MMTPNQKQVTLLVKGSVVGHGRGLGAWGYELQYGRQFKQGFSSRTANDVTCMQMEKEAVLKAIGEIKQPCHIVIKSNLQAFKNSVTDVALISNGFKPENEFTYRLADAVQSTGSTLSFAWVSKDARNDDVTRMNFLKEKAHRQLINEINQREAKNKITTLTLNKPNKPLFGVDLANIDHGQTLDIFSMS